MIESSQITNAMPSHKEEISNILINTLSNTVEQIVLADDFKCMTEHQLIKTLQSPPHNLLNSLTLKHSHQLFQLHFLVFHVLYLLKRKWLHAGVGSLIISPLKIGLDDANEYNNETVSIGKDRHNVSSIDKLAEYYLNLDHLTETSAEDVDQLILGFWKELYQPTAHHDALTILNLSPPVIYRDIKKQYKRLASKHHPDKGGSTLEIQKINQAMATLSNMYKTKENNEH